MESQTQARLHRFRELVALDMPSLRDTVYLSAGLAINLSEHLQRYAEEIKKVPFSRSQLGTSYVGQNEPLGAHPNKAYRHAAIRRYEEENQGHVEIDRLAPVSHGSDAGAYVQAWVWVYDDEAACYDHDTDAV